ncbi:hypothetical protein RFI_34423 [Reticulomyxa filosa]|uniref:Uncharacterized protein n=1 Tax=Reticulomyxa filosa TaxID=46433 RepID=X6LPC6_RETFI|nr:hypothetical protein RFI_34423 [Reticulomyxa filosa]|eukprot:ETO02987.1 hypothetical protein RFI_34423 [Reticulomyxa filosa]
MKQNTLSPQSNRTEPLSSSSSSSERSLSQEIEDKDNLSPTKTVIISPTDSIRSRSNSSSPDKLKNDNDVSFNLLNKFEESSDDDDVSEDHTLPRKPRQLASFPEEIKNDIKSMDQSMIEQQIEQIITQSMESIEKMESVEQYAMEYTDQSSYS